MPWFETARPSVPAWIVAVIVIVTESPLGIVPFHVTVLVPVFADAVPPDASAETSVNCDGNTSINSLPELFCWSDAPPFEMPISYVIVEPGVLVPLTLFNPDSNAGESAVVLAVLLLLPPFESEVVEVAVAVLLMVEPAGVLEAISTLRVNCALVAVASEAIEQVIVPLSPDSGVVHVMLGPVSWLIEMNKSDDGSVSLHEAFAAESGPLLLIVIV